MEEIITNETWNSQGILIKKEVVKVTIDENGNEVREIIESYEN
jgi:hypothetical protein